MKYVLLGYMASGKTIIANKLSEKKAFKHVDLDHFIESKEDMNISQIFDKKGEIAFRLMEHNYLKEILFNDEDSIISVGGGTPCYAGNMDLIINNTVSIYLQADIETIYNRIVKEKDQRPLVKYISNTKLKEFIAKHLFERNQFYNRAMYTIKVDNKTINDIVKEISAL